jgi:hypothetical protein
MVFSLPEVGFYERQCVLSVDEHVKKKGNLEITLLMEEFIKRIDFNAILTILMACVAMSLHFVGKEIE